MRHAWSDTRWETLRRRLKFSWHQVNENLSLLLDEMTAQANDGVAMSWVWKGEQPLKNRGAGCGLHKSNVICSAKGVVVRSQSEFGVWKKYDVYWKGELFIKQV